MTVVNTIYKYINQGEERTIKAKKNILFMLLIKGGNILIGIVLVPITLGYVDTERYGIWLALSSMVLWISFFDIGLNNGLKNRLAQALANNNVDLARKYVSTTYALLMLIFLPMMLALLGISQLIDWNRFLNIESEEPLLAPVCILIVYFCINFILNTISTVLNADQRPADASFILFLQQLASLIVISVLIVTTEGSLVNLCIGLCVSPIVVNCIYNVVLFRDRYKAWAPSLRYVDFRLSSDLMKLGVQFFIIQIAALIQYQMISFIIVRYYGPTEVTNYGVAYKYFNILMMVWGILITPLWVAVTDALENKDYYWIRMAERKYLLLFSLLVIIGLLMLIVSPFIYNIWVGDKVNISMTLSVFILLYNLVMMFGNLFVNIINGSGQLKVQTIASLFSPFVFLAVCYVLIKQQIGVQAVLIAAILSNFNGLILAPIQCYNLVRTTKE